MAEQEEQPVWFSTWHTREFKPHMEREDAWEGRVGSIERAIYGEEDNSHVGMLEKLNDLLHTANRINFFLDGVCRVWRIIAGVAVVAIPGAVAGRVLGWW